MIGTKIYRLNGQLHRLDGPAVEFCDGREYWFKNGKLHRENGAAILYHNRKLYWLNGKRYNSKEDWFKSLSSEQKQNIIWILDEI